MITSYTNAHILLPLPPLDAPLAHLNLSAYLPAPTSFSLVLGLLIPFSFSSFSSPSSSLLRVKLSHLSALSTSRNTTL